jgi:alpha-beta hydrolase superfamily lysophospholipase
LAHGLGGGADDYLPQIMFFVNHGYKVLGYNCTGSYESEGKSTIGFSQAVLDLDAALNYVEQEDSLNGLDVLLFGHSWGGFAVTNILNYDHDITAVVSVAGVNSAKTFVENIMLDRLGVVWLFRKTIFINLLTLFIWQ